VAPNVIPTRKLAVGFTAWMSPKGLIKKTKELGNVQMPAVRLMTLADMMHDGI
jgi:hypothetical protein